MGSSEAVAAHENRFASLAAKLKRIDSQLASIQWGLALLIGGVARLVLKAFA